MMRKTVPKPKSQQYSGGTSGEGIRSEPRSIARVDRALLTQRRGFCTAKGIKLALLVSSHLSDTGFAP